MLVALAHDIHPHHDVALSFFQALEVPSAQPTFYLCRFTQLGLLRLLTNRSAMGRDVLTLAAAWIAYDKFARHWNVLLLAEPVGIDALFRRYTDRQEVSANVWADGYLAAFATTADLGMVTFDKALAKRVQGSVLLISRWGST